MDLDLRDRVCVVTGSTAGIGLATARLLAAEGARVVVTGRDSERVDRAREQAGAALGVVADLAEPGATEELIAATNGLGSVDCLVNNVGIAYQASFDELTDEQWDEMWQLNVMSFVRPTRAVLPSMRERGSGVIVNVSSTAGKRPSTGMPNYSVTKAAVLSLSRLVADLYAKDGIRCNAITPGPTGTGANGFQNLETTFKYRVFRDPAHEFVLSVGLSIEWGGTGAQSVGADPINTYTPTIFFGMLSSDATVRVVRSPIALTTVPGP